MQCHWFGSLDHLIDGYSPITPQKFVHYKIAIKKAHYRITEKKYEYPNKDVKQNQEYHKQKYMQKEFDYL